MNWLNLLWDKAIWLFLLLLISGCVTHGHRKLQIDIFGQRIAIEDEVLTDDEGKQDYLSGFDENSSVVKMFFGWLFPAPDQGGGDEQAKIEDPDHVPGPDG